VLAVMLDLMDTGKWEVLSMIVQENLDLREVWANAFCRQTHQAAVIPEPMAGPGARSEQPRFVND
jgi:hypothetical protein